MVCLGNLPDQDHLGRESLFHSRGARQFDEFSPDIWQDRVSHVEENPDRFCAFSRRHGVFCWIGRSGDEKDSRRNLRGSRFI